MKLGPLCALLWKILTWCSRKQVTLKAQHIPGRLNIIADKLSRLGQTIQTEWSLLLVFQLICSRCHQPQVDLFATRFNNKLSQFDSAHAPGRSGPICFPNSSLLGQSSGEVAGLPVQENHSDYSRVAQHALVLRHRDHVEPNSTVPALPAQPVNSTIQSDPSHESVKRKSSCLPPRASAIQEQGFSEAVAAQIEAPQRVSTRSVCKGKWDHFYKVVPQ